MSRKKSRYHKIVLWLGVAIFIVIFLFSFIGPLRMFMPHIPRIMGFLVEDRHYLIVFQNNTELRPTGGFISSYGILKSNNGIPSLSFQNVYGKISEHREENAPYPHKELLGNAEEYEGYTFRDANHNPHFPAAAQELITFYNKTFPEKIDGVIAINYSALEDLVRAIGGISADGKRIAPEELFGVMQHSVTNIDRHNEAALANRKSILSLLKKEIAIRAINPWMLRTMSRSLAESMQKQDILFYFTDEKLQKFVERKQFAGTLPEYISGDALYINESNLGGAKSNRYISKNVSYVVRHDQSEKNAEVHMHMKHLGHWNSPLSTDYKGYVRFYLPPGSANDIEATIDGKKTPIKTKKERGYDVIGMIINMKINEERTVKLRYTNMSGFTKQQYTGQIFHQPGDKNTTMNLAVRFPLGETVYPSQKFSVREEIATKTFPLEKNEKIKLYARKDALSPRIITQSIIDLNTIELFFNEPLSSSAANGFNYEITDTNYTNNKKDNITIQRIEHADRRVLLKINGMTSQEEERYTVTMRNIYDTNGNIFSPNPKKITVIQRLQKKVHVPAIY